MKEPDDRLRRCFLKASSMLGLAAAFRPATNRLRKTARSDQELFDQMTELYPDWVANQSWLMFGFPGA